MTFEEYVQKHLGVSGMSYEDMELVGLGWAAHRDHGSCSEIPNSSGHAKEAKGRIEGDKSGYGRIADPALEGEPIRGYSYELASCTNEYGEYCNWSLSISHQKPSHRTRLFTLYFRRRLPRIPANFVLHILH